MKNYLLYSFLALLYACSEESTRREIKMLSQNQIGLIEYDRGDTNDTQIWYSDIHFAVLNYNVGHADFCASSARYSLMKNGKIEKPVNGNVKEMENQFEHLRDSLNLKKTSIKTLVSRTNDDLTSAELKQLGLSQKDLLPDPTRSVSASRNQVRKEGNALLHLSYSKEGITELHIFKNGNLTTKTISNEPRINSPCLTLLDITGDGKKELFIFYPDVDYWDSESYQLDIYDIHDFY